ncbi:uncharacterized protein A1O5_05679 [Cladophialophora psammophila CBS 110553]|uniref:NAD-dependent epimerase/dehydratase domain-containing protein n=1 Tax=Cladophialophora psammophila CBS 110553 TaxID=1182543 RepID=W9XJZ6_9EURO|nr:uncharacterized protein A1O5_05679 [Cladophialophora psammophila CBS 110553]EXJ70689.1 hypothetical protein A1O5_05679 [Cladophialophora psammophila CBS 110553]
MSPTTLLTGSNGFLGATVLDELLAQDHSVILAVRSPSSAKSLLDNNPSWPTSSSRITIELVPDFTVPGAFDAIFQSHPEIEYIVHVAAPMVDIPDSVGFEESFEKPNVLGNLGLLRSAKTYGKNVKAVSVTGSLNAITLGDQEDIKNRVFGSGEWLPLGREDAVKAESNYISYCVGKKLAEKALWKFVEEEKPSFTVTNFMPPLIFGPMLQKVAGVQKINFSNSLIHAIMNSKKSESAKVPMTAFPGWIDVRDLAKVQILALTNPNAANRRFVVGHAMIFNQIADALRKESALNISDRIGEDNDEASSLTLPRLDTKDVDEVFKFKWTPLDVTARDTAAALLKIEALEA